ncbi:VRR-NUC domain-containing protein [Cupriavidus basilensis]|uniref:VRR-NUC domain-containing protein n=1 Tax=Cupriavidus basilensis TaxID=68895 RepID=UPI000750EBD3|nr:VRR-NUC domain-containing protein [Cupriavidus basilensis]
MLESKIETHLVKRVKELGGAAYKFTSPQRRAVPDRLVLLPGGRVMFVECKATGQKPTDAQVREHARLRALGFPVLVLDSIAGVEAFIGGIQP